MTAGGDRAFRRADGRLRSIAIHKAGDTVTMRHEQTAAPAILPDADLSDRPAADLRTTRDEAQESEERLSYHRRVVQGQLDIARAEANRRSSDDTGLDRIEELVGTLADRPTTSREARSVNLYDPAGDDESDSPEGDALSSLPDLTDADLTALIERLEVREQQLSAQRREMLDLVDRIQSELVARYREGRAQIDEVLGGRRAPEGGDDDR